jgi:hypothetical protein
VAHCKNRLTNGLVTDNVTGQPFLLEDAIWILRPRFLWIEALGALLVEIVDGVTNRLRGTSELFCNLGRALPPAEKRTI